MSKTGVGSLRAHGSPLRRSHPLSLLMHLSTSPCDFGHRLHRLVRSSWEWNDSEVHRVGGAGYALLAERAGCVWVDRGAPRAKTPAPSRSRSLLLPKLSPADFTHSVPGDQLHGHAVWRAASVLRQTGTIEPVDHAGRDKGDSVCSGTSVEPHHGYAFFRRRPQCRECSSQFPFSSLRTKHRPADLSFLLP
jgi:hypothetical protein